MLTFTRLCELLVSLALLYPASLALWLGREFHRGKYVMLAAAMVGLMTLALSSFSSMSCYSFVYFGDFGGKSIIPENAIIFSKSLLGAEINRMYWMIPCDATTSRTKAYKRRQLKGGSSLECELESW
ncbi:hypothetical protein AVEN_58731-1 [Araneus ventricosus]|uniref:Uncharacterized protein n=1 Tax=Araneus ventricosus TaxID=182803 RepID=A0A4Y2QQ92_ARAVE|nr:hypothetical protein AVEN_58731-1 [Araneus ventricosus]